MKPTKELKRFVKDLVRLTNLKRTNKNHYYELRGVLLTMGLSEEQINKLVLEETK